MREEHRKIFKEIERLNRNIIKIAEKLVDKEVEEEKTLYEKIVCMVSHEDSADYTGISKKASDIATAHFRERFDKATKPGTLMDTSGFGSDINGCFINHIRKALFGKD